MERNKTVERISGAIFLIFLGSLFLLINFGYFTFGNLISFLFSIWPLFIVLLGIKIIVGILPWGKWINLVIDIVVDVLIIIALVMGSYSSFSWNIPNVAIIGKGNEVKEIKNELDVAKSSFPNATKVNYTFNIGAAEFSIADAQQTNYLTTSGEYTKSLFSPRVRTSEDNGDLNISFSQIEAQKVIFHPWRIKSEFNFVTPSDVNKTYDIKLGAGKGTLEINKNTVNNMKIDIGAGEMTLDINKMLDGNLEVNVGAGRAKIVVPKGSGYTIDYNVGVGELSVFRNDEKKSIGGLGNKGNASFNADNAEILHIKVNVGAGSVEIEEK